MGKFQVISHPLIQHKLSILRREDTSTKDFRELVNEIAMLMGYEVSRDLPLEEVEIQTPIIKTVQKQLSGKKLAIVPILRAGIGMVDGFLSLVPAAKVGHIGMYRDEETLEPVEYLVKLPEDIDQRQIFVMDPMLATGGSAILAVDSLKKRGRRTALPRRTRRPRTLPLQRVPSSTSTRSTPPSARRSSPPRARCSCSPALGRARRACLRSASPA